MRTKQVVVRQYYRLSNKSQQRNECSRRCWLVTWYTGTGVCFDYFLVKYKVEIELKENAVHFTPFSLFDDEINDVVSCFN